MWLRAKDKELKEVLEGLGRLIGQILQRDADMDGGSPDRLRKLVRDAVLDAIREARGAEREPAGSGGGKESRHPETSYREQVERHLNRQIRIQTHGGAVEGTVSEVGDGYAVVQEPGDMRVLVNLDQAVSLEIP